MAVVVFHGITIGFIRCWVLVDLMVRHLDMPKFTLDSYYLCQRPS